MRWIRFLSTIQGRMIVLYSLLFTAAFVIISFSYSNIMSSTMKQQRIDTQRQQVEGLANDIAANVDNRDADALYTAIRAYGEELGGRVVVMDSTGIVIADSFSRLNGRTLAYKEVSTVRNGTDYSSYGFHRIRETADAGLFGINYSWAVYHTSRVYNKFINVGTVLVSFPIQDLADTIYNAMLRFSMIALAVEVLLVISSVVISRWISGPIGRMTEVINEMGHGHFDRRIAVKGSNEVAEMAKTFNMMSERLENQDRMRSEFVANASHELKTPLSAIKILTESLIYEDNVPESTYKEFLTDINSQIDRLGRLMNDLLELSQIERPETKLNYSNVEMDILVGEAIERLEPLAEENGVTLVDNSSNIMLECDRIKMGTLLSNLLSNGIKYTPSGGKVRCTTELTDEGEVSITVTDTGIGIPHEDQTQIFERFYRVDKARSRDTGGTGLGLAIVQQVCRLHGGRVKVRSQVGKGSVFTVTLPQKRWDV